VEVYIFVLVKSGNGQLVCAIANFDEPNLDKHLLFTNCCIYCCKELRRQRIFRVLLLWVRRIFHWKRKGRWRMVGQRYGMGSNSWAQPSP